jgi:hypothetical protein
LTEMVGYNCFIIFQYYLNIKFWNFMKTEIFLIFWKYWNLMEILNFFLNFWNFEIFWNFWNFEIWNFWNFENFELEIDFFLILEFWNFLEILKFYENFEMFLKFWKILNSFFKFEILWNFMNFLKELGAIKAKIGPTSDVDKIFSKMYSQYVLFRNKYS